MEIDKTIREGVIQSLPEAKGIRDDNLRAKVYDAWAVALQKNGYSRIEEISFSAAPGVLVGNKGNRTQTDHLRGVARLALAIARDLTESFSEVNVDLDEVIAGGLCHDLGKPFEYNAENRQRWEKDPGAAGNPSIRHPVYGVHVALSVGLPEKIAHIAGAHSMEGENLERSLAAQIVHHADYAFWQVLAKAGIVD